MQLDNLNLMVKKSPQTFTKEWFMKGIMLYEAFKQVGYSLYPSLIVLNDNLLGQNAIDTLVDLKNNRAYQYIQVIVFTGNVFQSRKEYLLSTSSYKYIEKGESLSDFVNIAEELKQMVESGVI